MEENIPGRLETAHTDVLLLLGHLDTAVQTYAPLFMWYIQREGGKSTVPLY